MAVSYMMCWILNLSHAFVPLPSCKACLVSRRSCIIWQSVCAVLGHDPVTFHCASPQMWSFSTGLAHPAGFWAWTWEEKPCLGLLKLRPSLSQGNKRILCALDRSCGHSFISHPGGIKGWSGFWSDAAGYQDQLLGSERGRREYDFPSHRLGIGL